jgi:negative regulator of sigma E activity
MSQRPGSFHPSELADADRQLADGDLASAWSTARELESALPNETPGPRAGFADRVMAAVAREPVPRPAGFLAALRARPDPGGLASSVVEAWRVARGGRGWPARSRGLALAYVLAVALIGASLTGLAAYGAAGALGFLDADASPTPTVLPTLQPTPEASPSPTPTPSPEVTSSPEPSETVEPTGSHDPEGTDDHGSATPGATAGSLPEASDEGGGSSPSPSTGEESGGPSNTPRPSDAPKPSETPH